MNKQIKIVKDTLHNHHKNKWQKTLEGIKPNDPKLFKIKKGLLSKKTAIHPLLGPSGLVYDSASKAELFAIELDKQFSCPTGFDSIISPSDVWKIIKSLPKKSHPAQTVYPTLPYATPLKPHYYT